MTQFEVRVERDDFVRREEVEADKFEIQEGGVLVFFKKETTPQTLSSVTESRPYVAYNDWLTVEEL